MADDATEASAEPAPTGRTGLSIVTRLSLAAIALCAATVAMVYVVTDWTGDVALGSAVAAVVAVPLAVVVVRREVVPMLAMFRALGGTVSSYRDGDFAFGLRWRRRDELGELVEAHNALGDTLRDQRVSLVQRELLLDTMVQNTPVAMLLFDAAGHIVYANLTARRLLGGGRRMEGQSLAALLEASPEAMREAIERGGDGLFSIRAPDPEPGADPNTTTDDDEEIYYLARRGFQLNGRRHELFVLRRLTTELRRQEVRTWKKVIRVISHELNNSLAPIASLAHSGAELVKRGDTDKLERVFDTIGERARHLDQFISGYARFAKLPTPQPDDVEWQPFIDALRSQVPFGVTGDVPDASGRFDRAQIEQALVNLLRNAHESGSPKADVELAVEAQPRAFRIAVRDRGPGMTEAVLENALVPFYSTKRGGTGLGLALVREIAEAHGGRVSLSNRDGGGLEVAMALPR